MAHAQTDSRSGIAKSAKGAERKLGHTNYVDILIGAKSDELSALELYAEAAQGFTIRDIEHFTTSIKLYDTKTFLTKVMGASLRTVERALSDKTRLLEPNQSAVALLYAMTVDHAITVFESEEKAKAWLTQPCPQLGGKVPAEIINNGIGYELVKDYLTRIEYGVYQ